MRIESKFLTADAEVVAIRVEGGELVLEGRVKGFMPMVIRVGRADIENFLRVGLASLRAHLKGTPPPQPDARTTN
jgi:hypothetical protein